MASSTKSLKSLFFHRKTKLFKDVVEETIINTCYFCKLILKPERNNSKYLLILEIDKSIGLDHHCVISSRRSYVSAFAIAITATDRHDSQQILSRI